MEGKTVPFSSISVGGFFKESIDSDTWYLKVNSTEGQYESDGIEAQCKFNHDEQVVAG